MQGTRKGSPGDQIRNEHAARTGELMESTYSEVASHATRLVANSHRGQSRRSAVTPAELPSCRILRCYESTMPLRPSALMDRRSPSVTRMRSEAGLVAAVGSPERVLVDPMWAFQRPARCSAPQNHHELTEHGGQQLRELDRHTDLAALQVDRGHPLRYRFGPRLIDATHRSRGRRR